MKVKRDYINREIEVDGVKIANFHIIKIQNNEIYEIDNGVSRKIITLRTGSLVEFCRRTTEQGAFWFAGNKKQLDAILRDATMQFDLIQ